MTKHEDTATLSGVGSTDGLGVITRDEWIRRYSARVMKFAPATQEHADDIARIGALVYEENETANGKDVVWWGGPSGAHSTPEYEADEEMACWTDDGE